MNTIKFNFKTAAFLCTISLIAVSCNNPKKESTAAITTEQPKDNYEFVNGYPTEAAIQKVYDEADLNRAIQMYRFFILLFLF